MNQNNLQTIKEIQATEDRLRALMHTYTVLAQYEDDKKKFALKSELHDLEKEQTQLAKAEEVKKIFRSN